jgi:GGDEF-like domain
MHPEPATAAVLGLLATGREVNSRATSLEDDRAGLVERLRTRQPEIEAAVFALVERMIASVADEYKREPERTERSPEQRCAERVQRLLDGVPVDAGEFGYELDAWHVGVIATGANAEKTVRGLAAALGRELLLVMRDDGEVWAWLGGQRKPRMSDVERVLSGPGFTGVSLAVGEAARGVDGWRLTHREARAALLVAQHSPQRLTRYLDVALEAAALQDEALADSLIERYLLPLDDMGIGGQAARRTLRALFDTEYNVSSAAHPLKVHRSSVHRWREEIEQRLGYRLHEHQAEIEVALRIEDLRAHHSVELWPSERLN